MDNLYLYFFASVINPIFSESVSHYLPILSICRWFIRNSIFFRCLRDNFDGTFTEMHKLHQLVHLGDWLEVFRSFRKFSEQGTESIARNWSELTNWENSRGIRWLRQCKFSHWFRSSAMFGTTKSERKSLWMMKKRLLDHRAKNRNSTIRVELSILCNDMNKYWGNDMTDHCLRQLVASSLVDLWFIRVLIEPISENVF